MVIKQAVRNFVPQIRPDRFAEQRPNLEAHVFSKYLFGLWKVYECIQTVFCFYSVAIQIGRLYSRLLQVKTHHVLDLWHQDMKRRAKITVVACEDRFAEESLSSGGNDRGFSGEEREVCYDENPSRV